MNFPAKYNLAGEHVFKNIEGQIFEDLNCKKVIIKNSIIKNCNFIDVNMENCDLVSSKLYDVSFKNVSFNCADMFSLWFSECNFDGVDFSGAGLDDIVFIKCSFSDCVFEDVGLKNCSFTNTVFNNINPLSSSFILNQYYNCVFKCCTFRDTFQYQIFHDCQYDTVEMDYSLLKYNYGFGTKNGILYSKKGVFFESSEYLSKMLIEECINQNLFLNASFVTFNFEQCINQNLVLNSFDAIERMLSKEILIRNDEILFLNQLYQYMYKHRLIAPLTLYILLKKIIKLTSLSNTNIAYSKSYNSLFIMRNDLYFTYFDFCDNAQEQLDNLPRCKENMKLYIDYDYEPSLSLSELLNLCSPNTFTRVESKYGSFHEIIDMLAEGHEYINIFLQVLGITVPIVYTEIKGRRNRAKSKDKPTVSKEVNFNITTKNRSKNSSAAIQQTCEALFSSGILDDDLHGYNNKNIKSIELKYNIDIHV